MVDDLGERCGVLAVELPVLLCAVLAPIGVTNGDIEGVLFARGDNEGEKLGDIAGEEKLLS